MPDEDRIREIVRDELEDQGSTTRRGLLTLLGGGAAAGALSGGAAAETADSGRVASIGGVTADTYRITDNRYGGPASARSQLESELGNSDAGTKYLGEDNGALYHWTGSSWELMESTSAAVNTEIVNNEVYASEFSGAGLASKVENALDWLKNNGGGQGRVRVTPKDDGTAWTWDKDLTLNLEQRGGVELDIDSNVTIEYPGNGIAINTTTNGSAGPDSRLKLTGGTWTATGSNATGWLVIQDTPECIVRPTSVGFTNSTNDAFGLKIRNVDKFSEEGKYGPCRITADDCIVFEPVDVTGGSGSNSFHGTYIEDVTLQAHNRCLVLAGDFRWSMFTGTCQTKADGVDQVILEGCTDQKNFTGVWMHFKNEDAGSNADTTAYVLGSNYDGFYPPKLEQYEEGISVETTLRDDGASNAALPFTRTRGNGLFFEDMVSDGYLQLDFEADRVVNGVTETYFGRNENLNITEGSDGFLGNFEFTGGGAFFLQHSGSSYVKINSSGVEFERWLTSDLSGSSGSQPGETQMDDGTNTTHGDPDLCVWNGSAWRQVGTTNTFT